MTAQNKSLNHKVFILAGLLLVLVGVFGYLNYKQGNLAGLSEGTIVITNGQGVLKEVTLDDVKVLPTVKKKMSISSTAGLTKHEFTATPLLEIFNSIDPEIVTRYKVVYPRGVDGYLSKITMEEVLLRNNVYVVYADHDQPLKSKDGKGDTMRIVVMQDQFGQRFTNFLAELQLEE